MVHRFYNGVAAFRTSEIRSGWVLPLLRGRGVRLHAPVAAGGLLLLAVCVPPLLPAGYAARLSTITNIETDATGSAQGRWADTHVALGVVAKNPIVGVGIGQDVLAMNRERGAEWTQVHNAYLQYGVDLGIPGMRRRVESFGGTFIIESQRDDGTRVSGRFPVDTKVSANV